MKYQDLITVIVAGYNVEKYVKATIESIINQTYKKLEIILVDDGSEDKTGTIFDEYAKKDNRIITIHKKNGGLSDARNYGLKKATGNFISFIDGDDYIDNDFYEVLYKNAIDFNSEISIAGMRRVYEDKIINDYSQKKKIQLTKIEAINIINSTDYFDVSVCDKLFKTELFKKNKFKKDKFKKNVLSEDTYIIFNLIFQATNIYYDNSTNYNYIQRKNSFTHDIINEVSFDFIFACEYAINFINNNFPECLPGAYTKYLFACIGVYDKLLLRNNKKDKKEVLNKIRKNYKNINKSIIKGKRKLQVFLIIYFPHIYDFLFKKIYKFKRLK